MKTFFDIIKDDNNFVTNWKKNIAVYLMAECKETFTFL